jgi:hypothetical protein
MVLNTTFNNISVINGWKIKQTLNERVYMGKNLLSVPESVTSAIKNKRANIH